MLDSVKQYITKLIVSLDNGIVIESENTRTNKTKKFTNVDDLLAEIKEDILEFAN
ncbi:hypothetical protein [uncultured Brevibacillus sp.]|uniref:hypothetical protein n=1 Tax=uncultured Brevibacillus sp. TaxID=169970 RepID=UPI0025972588|nr:hypothetical protein [uncultured Brevibacillus sp.]